jgi:hypothetical protein
MKDAIGICWEFKHESLRDVPLYLLSEGKNFVVAGFSSQQSGLAELIWTEGVTI